MLVSDLLNNSQNKRTVISIAGAGGKTSIMFDLAEAFKKKNQRVLVTTTTRIFHPETNQYDSIHFAPDISNLSPQPATITVIGSWFDKKVNKLVGVDFKEIDQLKKIFDVILIEADGSHQKDIKFPNEHEPVVHPNSLIVIGVIGLNCLGKPINPINVHRHLLFTKSLDILEDQLINLDILFKLINHTEGLFKNAPIGCRKICILNQVDLQEQAEDIRKQITKKTTTKPTVDKIYLSGRINNQRHWTKI